VREHPADATAPREKPSRRTARVGAVLVSALFSPFVFLGGSGIALIGMLLWGIGYAVQDTLFKAVVADRLPEGRRNFAFGIFYTGYGVGWLIGSIATGLLYGVSVVAVNPGGPTAPGPIPAPR
jgi:MFS family permease